MATAPDWRSLLAAELLYVSVSLRDLLDTGRNLNDVRLLRSDGAQPEAGGGAPVQSIICAPHWWSTFLMVNPFVHTVSTKSIST